MDIAIYHPNLHLYGGGETVALTLAQALSEDHSVTLFCVKDADVKDLEHFFSLSLENVTFKRIKGHAKYLNFVPTLKPYRMLKKSYKELDRFDVVIDTCTNGWFDRELNAKTICYVHYPFFFDMKKGIKRTLNPLMIRPEDAFCYDHIICNSNFTKGVLRKYTDKEVTVIYPPVNVENIKPKRKKKVIVTIGRFTYDKKHEVMIDAFKEFEKIDKSYSLHIIGAFQEGSKLYKKSYLEMLKAKAKGHRISFHVNMPNDEVLAFLEEAKIYWHARGYGETDPNEFENFGITTVEAMAAGCIPIVINLGGQPEIVNNRKFGYCWEFPKDLVNFTLEAIKKCHPKTKDMRTRGLQFGRKIFVDSFKRIING